MTNGVHKAVENSNQYSSYQQSRDLYDRTLNDDADAENDRHMMKPSALSLSVQDEEVAAQSCETESASCAMITISVATYWLFVSLIPIYNKFYFRKDLYPFPIATAGIQLGVVAVVLAIWNISQHYYDDYAIKKTKYHNNSMMILQQVALDSPSRRDQQTASRSGNETSNVPLNATNVNISDGDDGTRIDLNRTTNLINSASTPSWILDEHFLWKMKWCTPIGILFGLKYGVTNLGLHLLPAPTHLLLQSTDLVWTVLGAWIINNEHVTNLELCCLCCCVMGSVILSWQLHVNEHSHTHVDDSSSENLLPHNGAPSSISPSSTSLIFALGINLLSPMLLGLCISTLRLACCELMRPNNRVNGTVSSVELTSIKLVISSLVAIVLATVFETHVLMDVDENSCGSSDAGALMIHCSLAPPWWEAFYFLTSSTTKAGVIGGAMLIAIFQVNCTYLTYLTSAVSVGLVGQVKIIPQWIVAAIFATATSDFTLQPRNIAGAFLIMISAAAFAMSKSWRGDSNRGNGSVSNDGLLPENHHGPVFTNNGSQVASAYDENKSLLDAVGPDSSQGTSYALQ